MASETMLREGLELMLKKIDDDIVAVEARLQSIARKVGVSDWRELDELFRSKGVDNPELDMLWPEYSYLRDRLLHLKKQREKILKSLERL